MNPNICNNCGGVYEYRNGRWKCRSCGAYKPEEISNEEVTLLYTAFQKLRLAAFDEAEQEFDDIVRKYPENHNGYWGRLLAKHEIKYEDDFDGKKVPTCYASSMGSLFSDTDYQKALQNADVENRAYYQQQADYIESVRKEWLEKAKREKPYDIFICYKDSDKQKGIKRTQDSIEAQAIYTYLTDLGYRVFYSHVSLRDKVGKEYEPYIFHALSTAKVMLVYSSNPEYITSSWLKNEWTRYQRHIRSGEKKPDSLLVACEGFSPNELPHALSSMQCFDATEKTFYGDLEKTIHELVHGDEKVAGDIVDQPIIAKKKKSKAPLWIVLCLLLAGVGVSLWNILRAPAECEHIIVTDSAVLATCTENGLTEGKHCSVCKEVFLPQTVIAASHKPGAAADCENAQYCTACHEELVAALGHIPGKAATCTDAQTCAVCYIELESAFGHTPGAEATCTMAQRCTVCGDELIAALGHQPSKNVNCTDPTDCSVCGERLEAGGAHTPGAEATCTSARICVICYAELEPALDHTPGKEATCTIAQQCTVCGDELVAAKGHTEVIDEAVAPTAATDGLTEGKHCSVCNEVLIEQKIIPASGTQGLVYELDSNGTTCTLTSVGTASDKDIFIPSAHLGYTVTAIGEGAFSGNTQITSITIPDTVTSIGYRAFYGCSGLTEMTIPASVEQIGEQVLYKCDNLSVLYYHSAYGNSENPFLNQSSVKKIVFGGERVPSYILSDRAWPTEVVILDNVKEIGASAFQNCTGLMSVTMGNGVSKIGASAFSGCTGLAELTLGSGVKVIDTSAFQNCTGLKSVAFGNTVTEIGASAFKGCANLESITFGNGIRSIGEYAFQNCIMLSTVEIPDSLTEIKAYTFYGCTGLTEIIIPDSIEKIGYCAFYDCLGITSVTIPINVKSIDSNAFDGCCRLVEVINQSTLNIVVGETSNGYVAYYAREVHNGDSKLTESDGFVYYPYNEENYLVGYRGNETNVTIPDYMTYINSYAFYGYTDVESLFVPDSVTGIGTSAFYGCGNLKSIRLPYVGSSAEATEASLSTVFGYIFGDKSYDGSTSIVQYYSGNYGHTYYIPSQLKEVTVAGGNLLYGAFYNCSGLTNMTLLEGINTIGSHAFYNCDGLTDVIVPDGVTAIDRYAFNDCDGLKSVVVPDSVTSIGERAFGGCDNLESMVLPFIGGSANGSLSDGSSRLAYLFGYLYESPIPDTMRSVTITGGTVSSEAFYGFNTLTEIILPADITSIGDEAFYGCSSLTKLSIPGGVTSIGASAFNNCTSLTEINLPNGLLTIGEYAFEGCTGLIKMVVPNSVTSIGKFAFYRCEALESITIPFVGGSADATTASDSTRFVHIFGHNIDYLPKALKSVTVTGGKILSEAFRSCWRIETVILSEDITSIGYKAFDDCRNLTEIRYSGTIAQWKSNVTTFDDEWNSNTGEYTIICQDGTMSKSEST